MSSDFKQMESKMLAKRKKRPQYVIRDGKPEAVILDLKEYEEMLERLEDIDDLEMLREIRKRPQSFRTIEQFLKENRSRV